MERIYDRGEYKLAKKCEKYERIFTERKKWKNFKQVKYCSKKCKHTSKHKSESFSE